MSDSIWDDFDALLWLRSKEREYAGYPTGCQDYIRHKYFAAVANELERLRVRLDIRQDEDGGQHDEIDRLRAALEWNEYESEQRLQLWRGKCGHHWIKSESADCPICGVGARIDETIAEFLADRSRLRDGLKTIADGELGTIEEAINYANTLVLSSDSESKR